jgi:hypothetical protein
LAACPAKPRRGCEVQQGRHGEQRDVVEKPHQHEAEQRAAGNAAQAVGDIDAARGLVRSSAFRRLGVQHFRIMRTFNHGTA